MKHEVIINSEDFKDYERLKKLEENDGAIVTKLISSGFDFRKETCYLTNEERKTYLYELMEKMTHNDELINMSVREFRRLRKKIKNK